MATIFEQALKELDEVKRGLSASNAVLFKGTIQAAEKAEDALKAFQSASTAAKGHLTDMLRVQSILEGRSTGVAKTRPTRSKSPCLICGKPSIGGRIGRLCEDHKDTPRAKKAAALKALEERERTTAT